MPRRARPRRDGVGSDAGDAADAHLRRGRQDHRADRRRHLRRARCRPAPPRRSRSRSITAPTRRRRRGTFTSPRFTQDGHEAGQLDNVAVGLDGLVTATYSNGTSQKLGKVVIANFANPAGLRQMGDASWGASGDSGEPIVGEASQRRRRRDPVGRARAGECRHHRGTRRADLGAAQLPGERQGDRDRQHADPDDHPAGKLIASCERGDLSTMDRLIHTALSAMRGAMARQTTTANNLANANTAGFRAEMASVRPLWITGDGLRQPRALVRGSHLGRHEGRRRHRTPAATSTSRSAAMRCSACRATRATRPIPGAATSQSRTAACSPPATATRCSATAARSRCRPTTSSTSPRTASIYIVPQGGDPAAEPQLVDRLKLVSADRLEDRQGARRAVPRRGRRRAARPIPTPRSPRAASRARTSTPAQALVDMIDASRVVGHAGASC